MSTLLEQASLVLIPSGYKEDTVYSVIPSNGSGDLSFTRASDGTRINSDGLVENTPWNLLQQSEAISTSPWTLTRATATTNSINSPIGTLTADTLISNVTGTDGSWARQNLSAINGSFSLSIYAKQLTSSFLQIRLDGLGGVVFDLSNGSIKSSNVGIVGSITAVGSDGWYRCSISGTATGQTTLLYMVGNSSMNLVTWSATIGDSIYLWGAQLNIGSTAKPYFPTTDRLNVPRLTYQNGGGGCPSLLLEPQRTNIVKYSQEFDNLAYVKTNVTITANTTISPDGTQNADTATYTGNGYFDQTIAFAAANLTHTISCWVKVPSGTQIFRLKITNATVVDYFSPNLTATTEWQRFTFTQAFGAVSGGFIVGVQCSTIATLNIWGLQLETNSSYASSYIPTTSASATRIVDTYQKAGIGNTSTAGTLYYELIATNISSANGVYLIQLFAGSIVGGAAFSDANSISIAANGNQIKGYNNGYTRLLFTITPTFGSTVKIALRYNGTNVVAFVDGIKQTVYADTSVGVKNALRVNNGEAGSQATKQLIFFPTDLTDAECISLTTL
jgi:hypothetical protein